MMWIAVKRLLDFIEFVATKRFTAHNYSRCGDAHSFTRPILLSVELYVEVSKGTPAHPLKVLISVTSGRQISYGSSTMVVHGRR